MISITFNERELRERLAALPSLKMAAFAAACAERLMPAYVRYSEKAALHGEYATLYQMTLEMIWGHLLGQTISRQYLEEAERKCLAAIPSEDEAWMFGEPYAEDAAAAVTFTIRALLSRDSQQAVWSARRVYEAVDNFAIQTHQSRNSFQLEELQTIPDVLIQNELARQRFDLEQLEAESTSSIEAEVISSLRARAKKDALVVFGAELISGV